ncbi:vacuolar protein sorting-associated protein 52, partial [Lecanoromycetidae sp. Uapishka_2]
MWLDRLSGHSTPSGPPSNRSFSPAPQRPSQLGPGAASRPGFSPRSSSLNVSAKFNSSTTSLNSPRLPNGSSLKQQVTRPVDFTDPLKLLEEVIGKPLQDTDGQKGIMQDGRVHEKPDELTGDIEFNGLGLQEFLEGRERVYANDVRDGTMQTAKEYEEDNDKFEDLHRSILVRYHYTHIWDEANVGKACDEVLKSVEVSLTNFQKDLGAVSAEIETLQSRSTALNTKLENRRVVEKLLGPAVEEISISPAVVKKISEGAIDQAWIKALEDLEKRSKAIDDKLQGPDKMLAASDLKPLLVDLTNLIKSLRSPSINAQIIQQKAFLAYKDLYAFLARHHAQLAEEIGQAYINTMRWYYLSHFTRYRMALDKIPLYTVDKHDALGVDHASQKAHDALSLGRRIDVLKRASSSALPSHIAEESKASTYLEAPFHAFNTALIDNASFEYSFLTAFFPNVSFHTLSQYFNSIFSPTFALGNAFTKQLIDTTYDCLGILLCVRLNQHLAFELQRRKCPVADGYINGTNMLLWPRFQLAMDMHVESVRRSTNALSSGGRATLSLTSSSVDSKGSTAPHVLTQRFGQFLQSILALSSNEATASGAGEAQTSDSEPVARSLERLRSEVEAFLAKAAKGLAQGRRERFLGNNYSLVLTIIGETGGGLANEMREWFEGLKEGVGGE